MKPCRMNSLMINHCPCCNVDYEAEVLFFDYTRYNKQETVDYFAITDMALIYKPCKHCLSIAKKKNVIYLVAIDPFAVDTDDEKILEKRDIKYVIGIPIPAYRRYFYKAYVPMETRVAFISVKEYQKLIKWLGI